MQKHFAKIILFFICITLYSISNAKVIESTKKHAFVHNHMISNLNDYDNGYTESRYREIIAKFQHTYSQIIAKRGGTFHILADWSDGAVNAWAERLGSEYHLEIPGGLSRYHLITEEGFITTICHELGHLIGGYPASTYEISFEGQSDYFAGAHCLKKMLPLINRDSRQFKPLSVEIKNLCNNHPSQYCERAISGALSVSNYYAFLEGSTNLSLLVESPKIVSRTKVGHPDAQCRLDTIKRAFLCPTEKLPQPSYKNASDGACTNNFSPNYSRPKCWFKK